MKRYRVIVAVTEYYEVYVSAEDIACENYFDGKLFNTLTDTINIEEEL